MKTTVNQTSQSTADGTSINNSSKMSKTQARSLEHTNENLKKSQLRGQDSKTAEDVVSNNKNPDLTQRKSMMASGQEIGG